MPFAPVPLADGLALHAGADTPAARRILTPEAVALVARLAREFAPERTRLLEARRVRQAAWDAGALPEAIAPPADAPADWQVAPLPADLLTRRVEITGPVSDARMVINMLSRTDGGHRADAAMVDFEDSMMPRWENVTAGVENLRRVVDGSLSAVKRGPGGVVVKEYRLDPDDMPTVMVRVRGLHLAESNVRADGEAVAAGLFDLVLTAVHTAREWVAQGKTPAFYVPKVEHPDEARWWARLFAATEDALELPQSTLRATFLIETLPAALAMEAILYELRDVAAGLNGGRWDKIFSDIKVLGAHPDRVLADRASIGMNRPWMRDYARQLIRVCHRHGAFAMGGMAAFTPGRDAETRAAQTAKVVADKEFEASIGHDGCWVSHPYFIEHAFGPFLATLGDAPNQLGAMPSSDPASGAGQALADPPDLMPVGSGPYTMEGLRTNVRVGIAYLKGWNEGVGCVAWDGLMEDLATLEISRAQTHQWLRHAIRLDSGETVDEALVRRVFAEETEAILKEIGEAHGPDGAVLLGGEMAAYKRASDQARAIFLESVMRPFLALASPLAELALPAPGTSGDGHTAEPAPPRAAT